ncbi:tetratricopeptide repeat protein [Myxosarcina sp. GI1]|uniref:tetratricopeptide repeat protein n=1 Tax=Myxosarcina sp. GI1 TaxID=1541065 RepID=UPI00055AAAB1|nr:tetratricopeptide repeat protein [Myxosarcina sp. GI1]
MQDESFSEKIRSYFAREEWGAIATACESAAERQELAAGIYPFLAKAYVRLGKVDAAIATYQKLLKNLSNKASADVLSKLNSEFEQPEVYAQLGLLYGKKDRLDEAVRHYQQALNLKPDWTQVQFNLAVIFQRQESWDLAIAAYQKTLESEPNAAAYFNLGAIYERQHNLEAAVASYQQAIALQPERIDTYTKLGNIFSKLQKYSDAIAALRGGLELDPTQASLHCALGRVYWLDGQPELSLASFEYAIAIDPQMAVAYQDLGKLWQRRGDYTAAIACFRKVIELEPHNLVAYSRCAEVLQRVGRLAEAIECWQRIISLQPNFIAAYIRQGIAIQPQTLLEMAKSSCARFLNVLEQKLNYSEIYHYLWQTCCCWGEIWFERGEFERAKFYFQQALEIKTDEPEVYLRLGNCLAKQRRFDAAIAIYRLGLLVDGDCRQLKVRLSEIIRSNSPLELFPVDKNAPRLPQRVYTLTQDWARDCQFNNFVYTTIAWQESYSQPQITKKRPPELVSVTGTSSLSQAQNIAGDRHETIAYFTPKQLGKNVYKCCFPDSLPVATTVPFVVTILKGRVWIAPQKSSWQFCDARAIITPDGYLLADLSFSYPWKLSASQRGSIAESHPLFHVEKLPPVAEIRGKVAVLSTIAGHSYERWLLDVIPKIEAIRLSGIDLDAIDWFVVNNINRSFQKETLELLKIPPTKILSSDRYSHIAATKLIVPSAVEESGWISSATVKFLRQAFLSDDNLSEPKYGKRIYVPGLPATDRQVINQAEVIELLTKHGFQTVWLEELSVVEQAAIFAQAQTIVAPHSSVLVNLAFCQPQTTVIELFTPHYVSPDYWSISSHLKLQHYYLVGDRFDCQYLRQLMYQTSATEDIFVELNSLELVLNLAKLQE